MVNHALPVSVVEGRVERFDDELCSHVCRHRPTDDAAAEYVEHDRKKREAGQCWYAGDARNPEPIGLVAASYAARRRAFVSAVKDRSFLRGRTSVADSIDGVNLYRPHEFLRLAGLTHHRHRGLLVNQPVALISQSLVQVRKARTTTAEMLQAHLDRVARIAPTHVRAPTR